VSDGLRLAEPLAALSLVADLTLGYPDETALRACQLAMDLARELGVGEDEARPIYWVTLLRYVGCTALSHESAVVLGGDDILVNRRMALVDQARPLEVAAVLLPLAGREKPLPGRALDVVRMVARGRRIAAEVERSHCEVARRVAERFGLPAEVADALHQLGERWDGAGAVRGLAGDSIALPARFAVLAHVAVEADSAGGTETAVATVRRLAGTLLDPSVAEAFVRRAGTLLASIREGDPWQSVLAAEPGAPLIVPEARLDDVARGFADVVDLKTPFLHGHSSGVAELAAGAARAIGLDEAAAAALHRAGLLHDLGRAGVPSGIWEKHGPLSANEWERVRLHPYLSERILSRSSVLAPLAPLAGMHHERLDGSGYHRGARASGLDRPARVLAAADVYRALVEPRPHRPAFEAGAAAGELEAMARNGLLDREAVLAVCEAAGQPRPLRRGYWPGGLTDREVEVLRLLARGLSKKEVAGRLYVSPSTVHTHVVHIYGKAGVSTRASAALFAMEHGLIDP
jgi:HD-GYP domain-containing protein (c-di-GMP phosphodiesterase class II)/DNA-binding CsgD family transcriptional regulator